MRQRPLVLAAVLVAVGLALAAGTWTASASPGHQPGPPAGAGDQDDPVPPEGARPPEGAGPPGHARHPKHPKLPKEAGPRKAISEAARQKAQGVTNPAGRSVPLSVVGFCRSQSPWMKDKGSVCDELNAIFQALKESRDDADDAQDRNAGDADGGQSAAEPDSFSLPAHRAAAVGLEMARGLLTHAFSLLA